MIFYALLNAVYRVSLDSPGAELEEGVQTPSARRIQRRAPARRGLICKLAICIWYADGGIEGLHNILLFGTFEAVKYFYFLLGLRNKQCKNPREQFCSSVISIFQSYFFSVSNRHHRVSRKTFRPKVTEHDLTRAPLGGGGV